MSRAAAEIYPVSRMLSSRRALPGPMRAPDSKTMLILTCAIPALWHAPRGFSSVRQTAASFGEGVSLYNACYTAFAEPIDPRRNTRCRNRL